MRDDFEHVFLFDGSLPHYELVTVSFCYNGLLRFTVDGVILRDDVSFSYSRHVFVLQIPHGLVESLSQHEFGVRSFFDHLSLVEHVDCIESFHTV